ncbi:5-oxoprolinase subunit B/C family protein [Nesterenkonia flava]|uniref:Carboxyltransferase domain-containing protein n=1 Tax=Nesterenkonia flava TaxID=469799 RepID=A0ABU1FU98_9MICC|nr:carboxyltransferase domain-containing protein [Nesterenkonia flava]MDR5712229.1 carboxyltransferase domain-containing protein [Nesterenkonia flava]
MVSAVHWAGQRALLLEFDSLAEVMRFHAHLTAEPLAGQREATAAARTVLLDFRRRQDAVAAARQVKRIKAKAAEYPAARELTLDVHYDGEDLDSLAEDLGMSPQALVDWHTSTTWVGAFGGFAPGFTYCVPEELVRGESGRRRRGRKSERGSFTVARHSSPRTYVPAGAVALAGEFSGIYPRESPGGWQLIGTTDAPLWDVRRSTPALIRPGDTVRYRQRSEKIVVSSPAASPTPSPAPTDTVVEVVSPGPQTLIQDLGRPGLSDLGVPRSGAADPASLRQANQLVGNEEDAAGFEVLYGGLVLKAHQTTVLAVTGAETELTVETPADTQRSNMAVSGTGASGEPQAPEVSTREVTMRAPFWLFPGERLRLAAPARGIRNYIAVSGGVARERVLGSASTDVLSGLGPAPVDAGQRFGLNGAASRFVGIADVSRSRLPAAEGPTVLRFVPGPREDWFAGPRGSNPGLHALQTIPWRVSQKSNRVGLRLEGDGQKLARTRDGELPSEPVVDGALQVPPSGEPVLFLADHPVTGGYPVIGVAVREDLPLAAQLPPGTEIRFTAVDPETLLPVS